MNNYTFTNLLISSGFKYRVVSNCFNGKKTVSFYSESQAIEFAKKIIKDSNSVEIWDLINKIMVHKFIRNNQKPE